jgi:N-methylhydantoinase B/oxoprolinase/acetone carboxylase alpha subunit
MVLDGAQVEVIRRYILSAAEEVRRTLIRTAFKPGIYEAHDFGISLYDSQLALIAEAPGLAKFLGANDTAIRKAVDYLGVESLEPGDVVVMNYPYWSADGHASQPNRVVFFPGTERQHRAGTFRTAVRPGEGATVLSGGGAGYGNPLRRAPERVLHDVLEGYFTETAAREIYAVVLKQARIDHTATALLRGSKARIARHSKLHFL